LQCVSRYTATRLVISCISFRLTFWHIIITDPISQEGKAKQSVASVRLFVRWFPLYLLNRLTVELNFVYVCVGGSWP